MKKQKDLMSPTGEFILYQTEDGRTRIQCRFADETIWLTQAQIAELFQTTPQNVTLHLKDIFVEGELDEGATCKDNLQVRQEGIDFAELQALRQQMTMRDWIAKLDDFLKLSEHELLDHAGTISAETAKSKAEAEYERYHTLIDALPRPVDRDFLEATKKVEARRKGGKKHDS